MQNGKRFFQISHFELFISKKIVEILYLNEQ